MRRQNKIEIYCTQNLYSKNPNEKLVIPKKLKEMKTKKKNGPEYKTFAELKHLLRNNNRNFLLVIIIKKREFIKIQVN